MTVALPDLESLACVDALARTLRFHAAAKSRFLSPAAFSKRVQQVEEHVGARLFQRTTRTVALTEAGAAVLPHIRRVLADASALKPASEAPVDVTIGTRHELGMSWLLPARKEIARRMPNVTLHLRFGSSDDLEHALLGLRIDAAVTSRAPSTTKLVAMPIAREEYAFVASKKLVRARPFRTPKDAASHTLLDADDALPLFAYLASSGAPLTFRNVVTLGTIDAIRAAALDGEGAAVLPSYFVKRDVDAGRLVRLLPRVRLGQDSFRLAMRGDSAQRPLLEKIATVLSSLPLR